MNGLTAGAVFLLSSFWDITQNHGAWTRALAATAMHVTHLIGLA